MKAVVGSIPHWGQTVQLLFEDAEHWGPNGNRTAAGELAFRGEPSGPADRREAEGRRRVDGPEREVAAPLERSGTSWWGSTTSCPRARTVVNRVRGSTPSTRHLLLGPVLDGDRRMARSLPSVRRPKGPRMLHVPLGTGDGVAAAVGMM